MEYSLDMINFHSRTALGFVKWLQREGFLKTSMDCEHCHLPMRLESSGHFVLDKVCWACPRRGCHSRISVRHGSFFWNSRLSLKKQLQVCQCFASDCSVASTARLTGVSRSKVTNYFDNLRGLYQDELSTSPIVFDAHGEYEVDEVQIKRVKVRRHLYKIQWVAGILERETGMVKLYMVEDRSTESLIPPILASIPVGNFIYTDEWRSYSELDRRPFLHFSVNHSAGEYARDEQLFGLTLHVHINSLEGINNFIRSRLKAKSRRNLDRIELILSEIMYRKSCRSLYQPIKNCLP